MFEKWDILWTSKFPEMIQCRACRNHFLPFESKCSCGSFNRITNVINKVRPVILWTGKKDWFESMAFAIPLSTTGLVEGDYRSILLLEDYLFSHKDNKYNQPMKVLINQATRIDGNVLSSKKIIGKVTNEKKRAEIEEKLINWIFN
jgi:hypothetical protein